MNLFTEDQRQVALALSKLAYCNPFLPERIKYEKEALRNRYHVRTQVWHAGPGEDEAERANLGALNRLCEDLIKDAREKLRKQPDYAGPDLGLYEDIASYALYYRYQEQLASLVSDRIATSTTKPTVASIYQQFAADFNFLFSPASTCKCEDKGSEHLFAIFYQIRRAFYMIFRFLLGGSLAAANFRAAIWQSIFTRDMRRYRRTLYKRMKDISALIIGESGTGKELVARAIAGSQFLPFDAQKGKFAAAPEESFSPLNLAALSPTLVESELFGHRRGAFTGAVEDHQGWLGACGEYGTVFLDEIAETDLAIQVKLLRVLETGQFQRLGDTETKEFRGKIVAATNRDLGIEIEQGRFRSDLYYRLCADVIKTPSLREQIAESSDAFEGLVLYFCRQFAGGDEGDELSEEVLQWIEVNLGNDYQWPGNVRELEQCIRNIAIRGYYFPLRERKSGNRVLDKFFSAISTSSISADEMLVKYCTLSYHRTGSYLATARQLELDRRTVKAKIDQNLLQELRQEIHQ